MLTGDVYQLMISGPSDVERYLSKVEQCVREYNAKFGKSHHSVVIPRYWKTDAYAQSGGDGQSLLNEQLVRSCDFAVAVFWNRFGTQTRNYGSGTEEEIEEMLKEGKQVFVYFVVESVKTSQLDYEQLNKVEEFKKRYHQDGKGLTYDVESPEEFKELFRNHLEAYLSTKMKKDVPLEQFTRSETIIITDVSGRKQEVFEIEKSNYSNSDFLKEQKQNIIKEVKSLKEYSLPAYNLREHKSVEVKSELFRKQGKENVKLDLSNLDTAKKITVPNKWIEAITSFSIQNGIKLEPEFWNLGNLRDAIIKLPEMFSNGPQVTGSENEIERYKAIQKLYWKVTEYQEYVDFFKKIDNISYASLSLSNVGDVPDDDIDVTLKIPIGKALKVEEIPCPGMNVIGKLNELNFIDFAFSSEKNSKVNKFPVRTSYSSLPVFNTDIMPRSAAEVYSEERDSYFNRLDELFDYEYFEEDNFYVIKFNLERLKHQTSVFFPTNLVFKQPPERIEFHISSSQMKNVSKGYIQFK